MAFQVVARTREGMWVDVSGCARESERESMCVCPFEFSQQV